MPIPPRPLKIHCKNCGYKVIYNPNSDCLVAQPLSNRHCPHCLSFCEVEYAKAIFVGSAWIVIEKPPYKQYNQRFKIK